MVCDQCAGYDITDESCPCCQREQSRFDLLGVEESVTEVALMVVSGQVDHIDQVGDNLSHLPNWAADLVVSEIRGKFPHLTE